MVGFHIIKTVFMTWLLYFAIRLLFVVWNWGPLSEFSGQELISAFLIGARFDMVALCYLNAPWALLMCLPAFRWNRLKESTLHFLYLVTNSLFLALNIVDIEMLNFIGRRSTYDVLFLIPELEGKIGAFLTSYFFLAFPLAFLIYLVSKTLPPKDLRPGHFSLPLILLVFAIGARGGVQGKPLGIINATVFPSLHLNAAAHNSTYSFLASYKQRKLTPVDHYSDWRQVLDHVPTPYRSPGPIDGRGQNIVLLIMESFSSEFLGVGNSYQGFTPFLDSIAERGVFFEYSFANGKRSMDAMPSILASIPSMTNESYITTNYKAKSAEPIGKTLRDAGYVSSFFHGGHNGTMFFDSFSQSLGIDEYHGYDQYPGPESDSDGNWGIFDEPFLKYMGQRLTEYQKPFVATFFSLTSHHPYTIPTQYQERFPKGTLEIHESIGYADHAIKKFFDFAKTQPWYEKTLYIITADHTTKSDQPKYKNLLGLFRVPLVLYHPSLDLSGLNSDKTVQQIDILPTIKDFLRLDVSTDLRFGESVFAPGPGRAIMNLGNRFLYIEGKRGVEMSAGTVSHFVLEQNDMKPETNESPQLLDRLKAFIQYYRNGLFYGRL